MEPAARHGAGTGITAEEADRVARSVSRSDVLGYVGAVSDAALSWLRDRSDSDLDRVPDFEAHQRAKPRYLSAPVWNETRDFVGVPTWQILARPCISHIRVHAGEIDILLQSVRARNGE